MYADTVRAEWKNDAVRVLVLIGSEREHSHAVSMAESFVSDLPGECDIKRFNAYDLEAKPCTGCNYCESTGRCAFDDLDRFFSYLETADVFVIASPVYNLSFPAPLKAILDRMQVYYTFWFAHSRTSAVKRKKQAYLLVSAGCEGTEALAVMEKQLRSSFSVMNTVLSGSRLLSGTDSE